MDVLAIIPARGGSQSVPRKNLREVAGRPLIAWSIDAAHAAKHVTHTVVSTEDVEIAIVAKQLGAEVLWRPAELATDEAPTDPVLVHAARAQKPAPDLVVLLQPTVPVRAPGLVDACIERLLASGADSLLTCYPLHFVWLQRSWSDGAWTTNYDDFKRRPRRQDFTPDKLRWAEDGSVYVTKAQMLLDTGARLGRKVEVFPTERSIDVDTERDLTIAEALLAHGMGFARMVAMS